MHAIAIEATATIRFSSIWLIFVAFINNHAEDDSSLCQLLKRAGKTFLITFSTISLDSERIDIFYLA